jgi:hypothetical protein
LSREKGLNPFTDEIRDFLSGKPEKLFAHTLPSSKQSHFDRTKAIWIVSGLQDALECGTLSHRHAEAIMRTRLLLETTNTIAKYLIDQLLITLA